MNCKIIWALIAVLAIAFLASADALTETHTTTDGTSATVNAGQGETFLCSLDAGAFSCTDSDQQLTCYGWANCAALDAVGGFSPAEITGNTQSPVSEPGSVLLLAIGLSIVSLAGWKVRGQVWRRVRRTGMACR
jgi:hypothetical protein